MKENKYYTVKSIDEFEFSEIDFDLYNEIHPEANEDEDGDGWYLQIGSYNNEGYPIQIDRLIKKLEEFKQKGANYVSMEYHCDPIGYPLEALNIYSSTKEEIQELENKAKKRKSNQQKIDELTEQIHKLRDDRI